MPSETQINNNSIKKNTDWDICKFLIFVLRHKPHVAKLQLDEDGFADINRIISYLVKIRKIDTNKEKMLSLISSNMKKTIEVKGDLVRARFGHSIILNMKTPDNFCLCDEIPKHLYGRVSTESVFLAMKNGLSSNLIESKLTDNPTSDSITPGYSIVIIDSAKASKENVPFYINKSSNLYFSPFIPSKFIHFKIK